MAFDLTCLQTRQAKSRLRSSSAVGGRQVTTFSSDSVDAAGVGVLQQQAAGDVLDDRPRRGGLDFDQAQVLLGGEALPGLGGEGGRGDGFDEQLGDLLGGVAVDLAVDADDAAEGRDRVAGQRLLVGLEDGGAGGRAAGVGVLDDGRRLALVGNSWASSQQASRSTRLLKLSSLPCKLALRRRCPGRSRRSKARRAGGDFRRSGATGPAGS